MNKYSVIALVLASATLRAQAPVPNKICVINLQSAMLTTKEGQAAADDFRTKFAEPEEKKPEAVKQGWQKHYMRSAKDKKPFVRPFVNEISRNGARENRSQQRQFGEL